MSVAKRYIVICEGKSEVAYLNRLQSFLDSQPLRPGVFDQPLRFIPKPRNGVGGGRYGEAVAEYKTAKKRNPRTTVLVWVDYDLYHRNYKNSQTTYSARGGVPAFYFTFHNFEDFLILHYSLDEVTRWRSVFEGTSHFEEPLHAENYGPLYSTILPDYKKGVVPLDVVTRDGLKNLKKNLSGRSIPPNGDGGSFKDFAVFLLREIEAAYPELMRE